MSAASFAAPTATVTAPQASPPRTRRRGLSYLRSYTHSRLSTAISNSNHSSSATTSPIEPILARPPRLSLSRSHSYPSNSTNLSTSPTSPTSPDRSAPPQTSRLGSSSNNRSANAAGEPRAKSPHVTESGGGTNGAAFSTTVTEISAHTDTAESDGPDPARGANPAAESSNMARSRAANGSRSTATATSNTATDAETNGTSQAANGSTNESDDAGPPAIRFYPHQEIPNGRPSLHFTPIFRTLPNHSAIIKVGRYSERDGVPIANPTAPSDAPVGFKSKVVSRKHCEFSFVNGSWFIKDVASSSGTFLNHVRLSQPNQASRLFPVKDGDVVQLGIDFRGGEEMIFRCVKIRIECNRSWQQRPNKFNQERHAQLQNFRKKPSNSEAKGDGIKDLNSGECSICLSSVMPCQSLFVAPCAHVWHFKCIYPLLIGKRYPHFACPNCRAVWNLEAEVDNAEDEEEETWEDAEALADGQAAQNDAGQEATTRAAASTDITMENADAGRETIEHIESASNDSSMLTGALSDEEMGNARSPTPHLRVSTGSLLARRQASAGTSPPLNADSVHDIDLPDATEHTITGTLAHSGDHDLSNANTPMPTSAIDILSPEGPLTPRNNAGPFVFDGSAGRRPPTTGE